MSKQAVIIAASLIVWFTLGIFNIVSGNVFFTGIIAFGLGAYMTDWELGDVKKRKKKGKKK